MTVQSRLGLAPRLFTDLATGHDLLGRKQGAGESFLRALAPLALQQIYDLATDDLSAEDKALGAALALGGAPVVPKSPIRRYRETLETLTGEDADQITPVERAELERRHPELQELRKQITAYRKERVAPLDQFLTQMDTLRDKQERLVEVFLKNKRGQPDLSPRRGSPWRQRPASNLRPSGVRWAALRRRRQHRGRARPTPARASGPYPLRRAVTVGFSASGTPRATPPRRPHPPPSPHRPTPPPTTLQARRRATPDPPHRPPLEGQKHPATGAPKGG